MSRAAVLPFGLDAGRRDELSVAYEACSAALVVAVWKSRTEPDSSSSAELPLCLVVQLSRVDPGACSTPAQGRSSGLEPEVVDSLRRHYCP